jgi:CBS domain-containing protein
MELPVQLPSVAMLRLLWLVHISKRQFSVEWPAQVDRADRRHPPRARERAVDARTATPTGRGKMRCEQIMKRAIECVTTMDTVQTAARRMRNDNIGFLPVSDDGRKVLGTITDRDIAMRVCADDRSASGTHIADVMTREVVSCRPTDDIFKAQQLMALHHKSRMLCIDESNQLVGVLSLSDIAQVRPDAGAQTLRDITRREAHL